MPELPEVETTRRGIEPHLLGKRVSHVLVREPRLRWPVSDELTQSLTGQVIEAVERRAKYLLVKTRAGRVMIHLGMSGSLRVLSGSSEVGKHDHIDIGLGNDQLMRYRDPRRFGSVFWLPGESSHALLADLGPEPLGDTFDGAYLHAVSRGRKTAVKSFLMNSHVVVGVGNIYANEALFLAGIRPDVAAGKISRPRYARLVTVIREVLASAIAAGGTSLKDFVREDGSPGYFKQALKVYGRGGQACSHCSSVLAEIRLGQRTTVFCRRCQR